MINKNYWYEKEAPENLQELLDVAIESLTEESAPLSKVYDLANAISKAYGNEFLIGPDTDFGYPTGGLGFVGPVEVTTLCFNRLGVYTLREKTAENGAKINLEDAMEELRDYEKRNKE